MPKARGWVVNASMTVSGIWNYSFRDWKLKLCVIWPRIAPVIAIATAKATYVYSYTSQQTFQDEPIAKSLHLVWSDSAEAACRKKDLRPGEGSGGSLCFLVLLPVFFRRNGGISKGWSVTG